MNQTSSEIKVAFLRIQNLITTYQNDQEIMKASSKLREMLGNVDLLNQSIARNQIYVELRDTVRSVFAYVQKVYASNQNNQLILAEAQSLLLVISSICSEIYYRYHPLGCGEMIKEFLSNDCKLFVEGFSRSHASAIPMEQTNNENNQQIQQKQIFEKSYSWTRKSNFKTQFHRDCCERIMKNLCKFDEKLKEVKVGSILEFCKLIYYMDDFLDQLKLEIFIFGLIESIENQFTNPSKQILKDVDKQSLEELSDYLTKILRYTKNQQLKSRVQLIGPTLGITMMNMVSIQKKIIGAKIVSKFAYEITYRNNNNLTQLQFGNWLLEKKHFQLIFQENCQINMIKASEDAFKLLVKKSLLSEEKFKIFFDVLDKSSIDIRKIMFRLIDTFRVDYYQIEIIMNIFKSAIKSAQYYDEQFFVFYEGISRHATQTQLKQMIITIQQILSQRYLEIQPYLSKRKSIQCFIYVFERTLIYKTSEDRVEFYLKIVNQFIEKPSECSLIIAKTLIYEITDTKLNTNSLIKLIQQLIEDYKLIDVCLEVLNTNPFYKQDIFYFLTSVIKKYKMCFNKVGFSIQTYLAAVKYPQLFDQILYFQEDQKLCKLLDDLVNYAAIHQLNFQCIKSIIFKLNRNSMKIIKKQYAEAVADIVTISNPNLFIGLDILKYIVFHSKFQSVRKGAAETIAQIFTNFSVDFRQEGELYLINYLKELVKLIQNVYSEHLVEQNWIKMQGCLNLIEEMLLHTEYAGVGSLRAHNALVATSTTLLKVFNNATGGDDVLKIYQKKIPSNQTLFQVILDVSQQFKIGPLEMILEYPNSAMIRYNGLTLEELKLNRIELNAIRLPQHKSKIEPLLIDGELNEKAKVIFTDLFNKYCVNGKMSKKQCSNYIEGVTLNYCDVYDSRINNLFSEYDDDKDGEITLSNFLRFYKESISDPQKIETVEKNLLNLRYRKDLNRFDEPLTNQNEEVLFRYHLCQSKIMYEMLFDLIKNKDDLIRTLAERILVRLPTHQNIMEELNCQINFENKNPFEVEYMLIAIQNFLNNEENTEIKQSSINKFLSLQNHLRIFQHLQLLYEQSEKQSTSSKNCFIICIHILRSLGGINNLNKLSIQTFSQEKFSLELPETNLFYNIIQKCIDSSDMTIFEPTLALQLTQQKLPQGWIQSAAFNKDKDVRTLTCNFIYYWQIKRNFSINLFTIPPNSEYNQEWFNLLTDLITVDKTINLTQLFKRKMHDLKGRSESLEGLRYDPIINGNLKIISHIITKIEADQLTTFNEELNVLSNKLISNENRKIIYQLKLLHDEDSLISDLQLLLQIAPPEKDAELRNKYVGIKNLGCICYMNSILQQFYMTKQFKELILNQKKELIQPTHHEDITFIDDFLYQLQKMYSYLEWSQGKYYNPKQFCLTLKEPTGKPINIFIQEDAHQFLNTAFAKVEAYLKKQEKVRQLENIFGGKTVTEIICMKCKNKIEKQEHIYHLSVEVKGSTSLTQSLDKFIQPEEISDYYCEVCQEKVPKITKQTFLKKSPQVLIINLQRIIFDLETFLKVKVHTRLQFSQSLDLTNYVRNTQEDSYLFNLKGVVIHAGTSESGHYYSLIKQQDKWYKFNDQSVTEFNICDLGREAFGGMEESDHWGDSISSTNAYILFYQKHHIKGNFVQYSAQQNTTFRESDQFREEVQKQNQIFYKQVQISQQSFFDAIISLYSKHKSQENQKNIQEKIYDPNYAHNKQAQVLEKLLHLHLKLFETLPIYYNIKIDTVSKIKCNLFELFYLLPEKAEQFLLSTDIKKYKEILCFHNDAGIRQLYQIIMNKAINVWIRLHQFSEEGEVNKKIYLILDELELCMSEENFRKNLFKSNQYFQFWLMNISMDEVFKSYMIKKGFLSSISDILMGNDSHLAKDKKRQELHFSQALPAVQIIKKLFERVTNFNGKIFQPKEQCKYHTLSQLEVKFFSDPIFYKKMMKNKYDNGQFGTILATLCYNDEMFSRKIAEMLIKGINSGDEIEDKLALFTNLKSLLLLEDQFTTERIKWLLGVPQLQPLEFNQFQYGLKTSLESQVYSFASSLLFIKQQKYMPFLHVLYEKKKYYNAFSTMAIFTFLELVNSSQKIFNYMIEMPCPNYLYKTYVDWIQNFITRLKLEDHYGLPLQKNVLVHKLTTLFDSYKQKEANSPLILNLPINKYIIGKNYSMHMKQQIQRQFYSLQHWTNRTYVMENKPFGLGNHSLPYDQYSFSATEEPIQAKYFIKCYKESLTQNDHIEKQWTVMEFVIKNIKPLKIRFKIKGFSHTIFIKTGEIFINTPFEKGEIEDFLEVEVLQSQLEEEKELKLNLNLVSDKLADKSPNENMVPYAPGHNPAYDMSNICDVPGYLNRSDGYPTGGDFYGEMECGECTYINVGRERCQMCDNLLYK